MAKFAETNLPKVKQLLEVFVKARANTMYMTLAKPILDKADETYNQLIELNADMEAAINTKTMTSLRHMATHREFKTLIADAKCRGDAVQNMLDMYTRMC